MHFSLTHTLILTIWSASTRRHKLRLRSVERHTLRTGSRQWLQRQLPAGKQVGGRGPSEEGLEQPSQPGQPAHTDLSLPISCYIITPFQHMAWTHPRGPGVVLQGSLSSVSPAQGGQRKAEGIQPLILSECLVLASGAEVFQLVSCTSQVGNTWTLSDPAASSGSQADQGSSGRAQPASQPSRLQASCLIQPHSLGVSLSSSPADEQR